MRHRATLLLLLTGLAIWTAGVGHARTQGFQVGALSTDGEVVDHRPVTGYDFGSLAAGTDYVYYTGTAGMGRFALSDLDENARLPDSDARVRHRCVR